MIYFQIIILVIAFGVFSIRVDYKRIKGGGRSNNN